MTRRDWLIAAAAAVATFILRVVRIRSMPIFNDESIYLRWGQLIGENWRDWVSLPLTDPKPPLHPLLLAIAERVLPAQPLLAGRALSAIAGAMTVLAAAVILRRLGGSLFALALFAVSPMLAFYQRMALADALFLALSVFVIGAAMRLESWATAIAVGVGLGVALLTRQAFSYVLFPLVAAAAITTVPFTRRRIVLCLVSFGVALCVWSPYLFEARGLYGQNFLEELRRRILYQKQFSTGQSMSIAVRNVREMVMPAMSLYLTMPVSIAALSSLILLAARRRAAFLILAMWSAAMIAIVIAAPVAYSRYLLPAVPALLIAIGVGLAMIPRPSIRVIVIALLCIVPIRDLYRQATRWDRQPFTPSDSWQYVTGWPAGYGTETAIEWLRARARDSRLAIITSDEWGNPADAVWVNLAHEKNVELYLVHSRRDQHVLTSPVMTRKWREEPSQLPEHLPVYYVARLEKSYAFTAHNHPVEDPVALFNPSRSPGDVPDAVVIYRLR